MIAGSNLCMSEAATSQMQEVIREESVRKARSGVVVLFSRTTPRYVDLFFVRLSQGKYSTLKFDLLID